jgi:hypothetical protein
MALDSLASWKELASTEILEVVRGGLPPASWNECRDTPWAAVLEFYCEANYTAENLKFLWAVADYESGSSVFKAEEIIEDIIYGDPPLNLYSDSSKPIDEWHRDEDHVLNTHLFDRAEAEIRDSFLGTYMKFQSSVAAAHDQLLEEDSSPPEPELEISEPDAQSFDISHVDMAVVDQWNQRALKDLDQGQQTPFNQFEDLVLIKHPTGSAVQPYWDWARTQDWSIDGAYVVLQKKGSVFDPGRIKVVGIRPNDTEYFEKAIARVSKKKIVY